MFPPLEPQAPVVDLNSPIQEAEPAISPEKKRLWKSFKAEIEDFKTFKKSVVRDWQRSIDLRRGKPATTFSDEDRIFVNMDWSLTKSKEAALYSQTPRIHIDNPKAAQDPKATWLLMFEDKLNDTLITSGADDAMAENLPDCINAAGFGASIVYYEAITEPKQVPGIDLTLYGEAAQGIVQSGMLPDGSPLPMETVTDVVDKKYSVDRISPIDFLGPKSFTGSNFDRAKWVGHTGRKPWSIGSIEFKLDPAQKAKYVTSSDRDSDLSLISESDGDRAADLDPVIEYDEIFYRTKFYDPEAKSFNAIHRLVFVKGKSDPVIDEPWNGQRLDPSGRITAGTYKYPIRVLTLTYLTDESIPPSDSAVGRPQVKELNEFRTHALLQFKRSMPMRWADINRLDPQILLNLMRGEWQNIIPVQGEGSRVIGEVAQAKMSQEDYTLNKIAQSDLADIWQLGPNQQGNFSEGRQSATEASVVQQNYTTRIGKERARVAAHFVSIAEVLGSLLCLYEDPSVFGEGFDPTFSLQLSYSIIPDSTVFKDTETRKEELKEFINFTAKSGFLNIEPVLREFAVLNNLDPNVVIKAPTPPPPTPPSVSIRISGAEDMMNPLVLAQILANGQPPTQELIAQAKALITFAMQGMINIAPPPTIGPDGQPIEAEPPTGPGGTPLPEQMPVPIMSGAQVPGPAPLPPPPVGGANPDWDTMTKISKRSDYGS